MTHYEDVTETPRERLSRFMDERRRYLRKTWDQVAADASITYETIRQVRAGAGDIRPLTKRGIEDALDWGPGSVDQILAGSGPTIIESRNAHDRVALTDSATATVTRVEDRVEQLIQDIYDDPKIPDDRKRELVRLIRRAEAQRLADLQAVEDEVRRYRAAG